MSIDDFSRYTWVYPLHDKLAVFLTFVNFKRMIEAQLSNKIKILRTNNGGEYVILPMQTFLNDNEISH